MKPLKVAFVLMPIFGFSSTYTWNGLTSSDLNTAANWSPTDVPGVGDIALFDSTTTSRLAPTASNPFSVADFSFNNSAQAFQFVFDNTTLTFNNMGIIGAATNTSITSNNINNSALIDDQVSFIGPSSSSGSALIIANNSGTASLSDSGMSISIVSDSQIYSTNAFSMLAGGQLTATNAGTDSSTASGGNAIGEIGNPQMYFFSTFNAGNSAGVTITNTGTYTGTSGSNHIGIVSGGGQFYAMGGMDVADSFSLNVTNEGTN
jgi:hypothetical protein